MEQTTFMTLVACLQKTMNELHKIAVYIPDEDAKKFLAFQENYELFSLLLEKGVFHQKNGCIMLNFDQNGILQTIERKDYLWSKRFDK